MEQSAVRMLQADGPATTQGHPATAQGHADTVQVHDLLYTDNLENPSSTDLDHHESSLLVFRFVVCVNAQAA